MSETSSSFHLRAYEKHDFDALFKLDQLCFTPTIAFSRPELSSYIEQRRSYTIVAEWVIAPSTDDNAEQAVVEESVAPNRAAALTTVGQETNPAYRRCTPKKRWDATPAPRRPIAGFITFHLTKQGYGHIITLDVRPDARRQRLGSLLMQAACERLRQLTAFLVELEVATNNHGALQFYERHGFHRVKVVEGYYNHSLDAIVMTKRL